MNHLDLDKTDGLLRLLDSLANGTAAGAKPFKDEALAAWVREHREDWDHLSLAVPALVARVRALEAAAERPGVTPAIEAARAAMAPLMGEWEPTAREYQTKLARAAVEAALEHMAVTSRIPERLNPTLEN